MNSPALRQSVQTLPSVTENGVVERPDFWFVTQRKGDILSGFGTRERERQLRDFDRHDYNTLWKGARSGLTKKVKATPWEISGPKRGRGTARYFQDVFRDAHFGAGWGHFIALVTRDYLRQDGGAYIEIIAPGRPDKAPTGPITGLAYLDSQRCIPTGDPEYPVIYYDRKHTLHRMHHTRVVHWVDMPDGDESAPGYGECALSRAIAVVQRQLYMGRYIVTNLDDLPPPGIVVASNVTREERNRAASTYRDEQTRDQSPVWGKTLWMYSTDPQQPAKLEVVAFSRPPEKFDYAVYVNVDVNELALAIGVDKQELWELSGGSLGSGQQSVILHAKSQGKAYGDILTSLERALNDALPESCEFQFKQRDPFESKESAETAQIWTGVASNAGSTMTDDEKRQMLANQVEAIKDAITDENGEIVRLDDADVEPEAEVITDDTSPAPSADEAAQQPVTADGQRAAKAIQATRLDFEADFEDALKAADANAVSQRGFATIVRGLISRYGRKAYIDGLVDGGVADGELDDDDEAELLALIAGQSAYVNNFAADVYDNGLSEAETALKPAMWWNKSVEPMYDAGRFSADKNGYYGFEGDDGAESCKTCRRLKGQVHRMKDWTRKRLRPKVDTENFDCGGFQCSHQLVKAEPGARARGRW
jgi:hypothetical protein